MTHIPTQFTILCLLYIAFSQSFLVLNKCVRFWYCCLASIKVLKQQIVREIAHTKISFFFLAPKMLKVSTLQFDKYRNVPGWGEIGRVQDFLVPTPPMGLLCVPKGLSKTCNQLTWTTTCSCTREALPLIISNVTYSLAK